MAWGSSAFRVNGIVRETLVSGSGALPPSDVVVRVATLTREALLAAAGTFHVAAVVLEALVSEADAPPPADVAPRFWVTVLAYSPSAEPAGTWLRCTTISKPSAYILEATMTDPASSGAAGAAAFKAVGGASAVAVGGAGLAAVVVMLMTPPRSPREWAVGLISTVISSIGGGAAVIEHFGLQHWVSAPTGLCGMGGLIFGCGLPGWAIVRWVFNFIDRNRGAGIDEVAKQLLDLRIGPHGQD